IGGSLAENVASAVDRNGAGVDEQVVDCHAVECRRRQVAGDDRLPLGRGLLEDLLLGGAQARKAELDVERAVRRAGRWCGSWRRGRCGGGFQAETEIANGLSAA